MKVRTKTGARRPIIVTLPTMGELIDLEHTRRARRMLGILLARFGVLHFLRESPERPFPPRIDEERLLDAVDLAMEWIERRTGRVPTEDTRHRMTSALRRALVTRVAESMVRAGY
jgi:hypothetical protein